MIVGHVNDADIPWVDCGGGIELKVIRVDQAQGHWVVRNRFQPGVRLQTHRHTGCVNGLTISGCWMYEEYGVRYQAGTYIFEPAGSVHTLVVPDDLTEPTDAFFVMEGVNLNLDSDGNIESVTDGMSTLNAYYALCEAQSKPRPTGIITN